MIKRHGIEGTEVSEIVLVGSVVAVPGNNIEWRVLLCTSEHLAHELGDQFKKWNVFCTETGKRGRAIFKGSSFDRSEGRN